MSKVQKKMDNFFLKELKKKNTETTEQEQNISLSSKEIISPEPLPFKGFPTNTMTKNPVSVSVSHLKLKQTKSPTIKSMTQSLPTRSNQDEFSKSNTTPQSGGSAVVHDKNTKRHLKNKVNQKDLLQLITNISATSLKLKNSAQKVLGKQKKKRVSRQKSFHLFPSKTFIHVIYVYTVIKPCQR